MATTATTETTNPAAATETTSAAVAADKRVMACNFTEGTSDCPRGALAYVQFTNRGARRVAVLARSRCGRWIETYRPLTKLKVFRMKTIPPEHPLYARLSDSSHLEWMTAYNETVPKDTDLTPSEPTA